MSYLVLARKWRPQRFDEVTGQQTIVKILKNAIKQNRIAHAYLFSGPRGVGKTTTARILAKTLNCKSPKATEPCNQCDSCVAITAGHSMDVIEIDGASTNSVDHIRQLREQVKYAPSSSRYKVYIIDEAHMLSTAAFNALLKTLEEPPEHVIFILATTEPHKIPVTVQSRCQHLPFRRIPTVEIQQRLETIASEEGLRFSQEAIEMISKAADGSMRDALTLLDQIASFTDEITEETVQALVGITDMTLVLNLVKNILDGNKEQILKAVEELYNSGADLKATLTEMVSILRSMLVAKITSKIEFPDLTENQKIFLKEMLPAYSEEEIFLCLHEILKVENLIKNASFPRVAFEIGLIKASLARDMNTVGTALKRLEDFLLKTGNNDPESSSSFHLSEGTTNSNYKETPPDRPSTTVFEWDAVIGTIDETNPVLASKLIHAQPELEGSTLRLIFNGGNSIHADAVKKHLSKLTELISKLSNNRIKKVLVETLQEKPQNLQKINGLSEAERLIIDTFGGTIVERRKTDV